MVHKFLLFFLKWNVFDYRLSNIKMYLIIDCEIPLLLIPSNAYFLSVSYYPLPQFLLSVPVLWSYFKSYSISKLVKYLRLWTVSADNKEGLAIL